MIEPLNSQKWQDPSRDLTTKLTSLVMKILSWNVRSLGRPFKCHLVKNFIFSSRADIICLQEFKLQYLHRFH